jgi:kumamolisin
MVASISSKRVTLGKPRLGCLSPALYTDANVQAAFRDITSGGTASFSAGPGWDFPTGWGAPKVAALADALP